MRNLYFEKLLIYYNILFFINLITGIVCKNIEIMVMNRGIKRERILCHFASCHLNYGKIRAHTLSKV